MLLISIVSLHCFCLGDKAMKWSLQCYSFPCKISKRAVLTGSAKTYDFYMFVWFAFMYALFLSNVHIVRTFENRIPFQTFKKWHNISYHYASYVKSETFNIWRTAAWFLKPFGGRIEENYNYHLVKPNSKVKTRTVYRVFNICYQVFFGNRKIVFNSKIWNFDINFQT